MREAYSVRFDAERWSTGSWFGMQSRYRMRWQPLNRGACASTGVWLPLFISRRSLRDG